jgi:hypothetical protein
VCGPVRAVAGDRESEVFAESVAMMADAMKVTLDRIDFDVTFTAATAATPTWGS